MSKVLNPPSTQPEVDRSDADLELFLQVQGRSEISIIRFPESGTVSELIAAAAAAGILPTDTNDTMVSLPDEDEPLAKQATLRATGVRHHHHLHCHRCQRVTVSVRFNGAEKQHEFPAAAQFRRIHAWATGKHGFGLSEIDAAEHLLQVTASGAQPAPGDHLGSVVTTACSVSLDLVPKQRIEG